jgi:hypothetical protein
MNFCHSVCCSRSCDDLVGRAHEGCRVVEDCAFEDCALGASVLEDCVLGSSVFEGCALEDGVVQICGSEGRDLETRSTVDDMRGRRERPD